MPIEIGDSTATVRSKINAVLTDAGLNPADNVDTTAATNLLNQVAATWDVPVEFVDRMPEAEFRTAFATLETGGGVQRLRLATTRGEIPTATTVAGANSLRAETRKLLTFGGADFEYIQLGYAGFSVVNGLEVAIGNDQSVQAAIEGVVGGTPGVVRVTFGGQDIGVIPNGSALYLSDPIPASAFGLSRFPKSTEFYVREQRDVALGQGFTRGASTANINAGERTYLSNGQSASQLMATGGMSTPAGGSGPARMMGPVAVFGKALGAADFAVIGIGDSIMAGSNDTAAPNGNDGRAGGGFVQRGLYSVNGRAIPFLQMGVAGTQAQQFVSSMSRRQQYFQYATHLLENYGTNDFADGGRTAAQVYADRQSIWAAFKAASQGAKRVDVFPILPRTNNTPVADSWATLGNQTPRSGYAAGGAFRDPLNANLATAISSGLVDGIVDLNAVIADAGSPDKWIVNGSANYATSDGTHPSPTASAAPLMATAVTNRALSWAA